jgi:hypothetical protein
MSNKSMTDVAKMIAVPSFYHSVFNAIIISLFFYSVFVMNYFKKLKFFAFLIPLIISGLIFFSILNYLKPQIKDLNFGRINDANMYFTKNAFYEYTDYKIYIGKIDKTKIDNMIIVKNDESVFNDYYFGKKPLKSGLTRNFGGISIYSNCNVNIDQDKINISYLSNTGKKDSLLFTNEQLRQYNLRSTKKIEGFFKNIGDISKRLIESQKILFNLLLWLSISFFLLSLSQLINVKNNPFLSFVLNFLFLILFYIFFITLCDIYKRLVFQYITDKFFKETVLSFTMIVLGLLMLLIRFLFFKSYTWESE